MTLQKIKFKKALLKDQWHDNVCLTISNDGLISDIQINDTREATRDIQVMDAYALPGMANVHSHAFQRAMAGLAEYATSATNNLGDSFWTWRDVMYRFAGGDVRVARPLQTLFKFRHPVAAVDKMGMTVNQAGSHILAATGNNRCIGAKIWQVACPTDPDNLVVLDRNRALVDQTIRSISL